MDESWISSWRHLERRGESPNRNGGVDCIGTRRRDNVPLHVTRFRR